jgi:hypothetical protein
MVTGDYPAYLRTIKTDDMDGSYLPTFTPDEQAAMKEHWITWQSTITLRIISTKYQTNQPLLN